MLAKINYSALVKFSIPSVLAALVEPLASIVDTSLVGRFSTEMLAAMAICTIIFNSLSWMFNFLIHTSTQKIADYNAQKDETILSQRILISLSLALIISLLTILVMYFFKTNLYQLAGAGEDQFYLADEYYLTRVNGHIFSVFFMTLLSIIRGLGYVRDAFYITVFSTAINIALSYSLLHTFQLGLTGIALGTVVSHGLGTFLCFLLINQRKKGLLGKVLKARPVKSEWVHFGKNSLDVFGRSLILTSCFFLATRFSSLLGHEVLAAHQILLQLWLFCSFFIDGLASSANILMSYYFGKKELDHCRLIVSMYTKIASAFGVFFSLLYILFGTSLLKVFTLDQNVIILCLSLLPIIYSSQIISCIAFIYDGVLFGLEKFSYLRKHMIIGGLLIFLPISSVSMQRNAFIYIWLGLVFLNVYRVITGHIKIRSELCA
jgi:putative MATE family efflux protein